MASSSLSIETTKKKHHQHLSETPRDGQETIIINELMGHRHHNVNVLTLAASVLKNKRFQQTKKIQRETPQEQAVFVAQEKPKRERL